MYQGLCSHSITIIISFYSDMQDVCNNLITRINYIIMLVHTEVQFGIIIILASLYYDYNGDDQINFKGSLQIMISTS